MHNQILENFKLTRGPEKEGLDFLTFAEIFAIRNGHRDYFTEAGRRHASEVLTRWRAVFNEQ